MKIHKFNVCYSISQRPSPRFAIVFPKYYVCVCVCVCVRILMEEIWINELNAQHNIFESTFDISGIYNKTLVHLLATIIINYKLFYYHSFFFFFFLNIYIILCYLMIMNDNNKQRQNNKRKQFSTFLFSFCHIKGFLAKERGKKKSHFENRNLNNR